VSTLRHRHIISIDMAHRCDNLNRYPKDMADIFCEDRTDVIESERWGKRLIFFGYLLF
jgi:hypothetical protein